MKKLLGAVLLSVLLFFSCGNPSNTTAPPPDNTVTCSIQATPNPIHQGESTTITWTSVNADTVRISGLPDVTSPSGVITVSPETTTTYSLIASRAGVAAAAAEVVVTVIAVIVPPPPPPPPPAIFPVYITATWELPTTYSDGTPIPSTVTLSVLLYMKSTADPFLDTDLPIAEALPNATSVDFGPVDVDRNATYYFSCKAKTDTGEISEFAPSITHIWN